jgi:hypothetical protein
MTVTDFTFPQSGDADYSENFNTWLGRSNLTDYVEEGMSVSISDASAPELTITEGKAFISQDQKTISANSETRLTLDYCIIKPQETVVSGDGLTDSTVNYIYLEPNFATNDDPIYVAYTDQTNAGANDLLIAEVDLSADTVTQRNRDPDSSWDEGAFSFVLNIPVTDDTSNLSTGQGNLAFVDGTGSQDEGLHQHTGSAWEKVGLEVINELDDVSNISGFDRGTTAQRPAAGTEGRIYFNTTANEVQYDTGSTWVTIGIDPAEIGAGELGFDPATQTELDNHENDFDAHHSRYTNEEAQDAVGNILDTNFTYDDATPEINLDDNFVLNTGDDITGSLNFANSDSIQDVGANAITFDGSANVTIPNRLESDEAIGLAQYADVSTAESNTVEGDIIYVQADNSLYLNDGT